MMDNAFSDTSLQVFFNRTTEIHTAPMRQERERQQPSPVTLRLTAKEREKLEELAQTMTLSAYIRMCIFQDDVSNRKVDTRAPVQDREELAKILGLLGQSRIANNLNQLAKEANIGALLLDEQTERRINETYLYVVEIRQHLIKALGLKG